MTKEIVCFGIEKTPMLMIRRGGFSAKIEVCVTVLYYILKKLNHGLAFGGEEGIVKCEMVRMDE